MITWFILGIILAVLLDILITLKFDAREVARDILTIVQKRGHTLMTLVEDVAIIQSKVDGLNSTIHSINLKLDDVKDLINQLRAGVILPQAQIDALKSSLDIVQEEASAVLTESDDLTKEEVA